MQNKYALVTGGSRGIGRAACIKLAEMGYNILVNYKGNKEAAEETAGLVREKGVMAEVMAFDVADREDVKQVLGSWIETYKENIIEILVNNAGVRNDILLPMMNDEQWDSVINTSL